MRRTVAIIGMGLIGGSLALALKRYTQYKVLGYDACRDTLDQAVMANAVDQATSQLKEAVGEADIVIFCLPVSGIAAAVAEAVPYFKSGAVITDVASTKETLLAALPNLLPPHTDYIGGHPMAGSEKSGFGAAHADLFIDKPYILTLQSKNRTYAVKSIQELITAIGAMPVVIDGMAHDTVAAQISHVPHVVAAALVTLAHNSPYSDCNLAVAAGGFRDITRIASANPALWTDICLTNRKELVQSLMDLQRIITQVVENLQDEDAKSLHAFFDIAKKVRDDLFLSKSIS